MPTSAMVSILLALPAHLAAQKTPPRLYLTPDLTISAKLIKGTGSGSLGEAIVGADGRVVVIPKNGYGDIQAFDSLGNSLGWKLNAGKPDSDIDMVGEHGWMGTHLWLNDRRYGQLVVVDEKGMIVRSIEYPSWIRPRWAERRKYPLFARMKPLAIYPDSTMLVEPRSVRSIIDTPGFDRSLTYWMRTDLAGAVIRTITSFDPMAGLVMLKNDRAEHSMSVPHFGRTLRAVSSDGRRIAEVTPARAVADSGRFRVVALSEKGDTVYNRTYPWPAVPVDTAAVGVILRRIQSSYGSHSAADIRARLAAQVPAYRSFLTRVHVGLDKSTWIVLRPLSDTAVAREALVLDAKGDPIAMVQMPVKLTVLDVDRAHLWVADRKLNALVRLRLQSTPLTAAPPVRSAPASGAKAPVRRREVSRPSSTP